MDSQLSLNDALFVAPTQLRERLRQRHVGSGTLFQWMDANRNDSVSLREFMEGIAYAGIRCVRRSRRVRSLRGPLGRTRVRPLSLRQSFAFVFAVMVGRPAG